MGPGRQHANLFARECIPVDSFYLTGKAGEYGVHARFIERTSEGDSGVVAKVTDAQ